MTTKHEFYLEEYTADLAVASTLKWTDFINRMIADENKDIIEAIVRRFYSRLGDVHDGYIAQKVDHMTKYGAYYLYCSLDLSNRFAVQELFLTQEPNEFCHAYYVNKHGQEHEEMVELGYSPQDAAGIIESQKENNNE